MQFYCQNTIRPKKNTKLCLLVEKCVCSSTIRFVPCAFFINKQFRTCAIAFPNEFTVRLYEYCAGKHWILYWIQENKTATYFLRSRLFTYDNMKNFNCN